MRSVILGGFAALFFAATFAVLVFDLNGSGPDQPVVEAELPLTAERLEKAEIFPKEAVNENARRVGGEGFAAVELGEQTIARLPARPQPLKPLKPDVPKLPPDPVSLQRPLIEKPGHLQTNEVMVRLAGIVSPDLDLTCDTINQSRRCGRLARTALRNFVRGRTTVCIIPREQREEAIQSLCTVGGKDVAEWLVEQGWAVADGSKYDDAMKYARGKKLGLWQGGANAKLLLSAGDQSAAGD